MLDKNQKREERVPDDISKDEYTEYANIEITEEELQEFLNDNNPGDSSNDIPSDNNVYLDQKESVEMDTQQPRTSILWDADDSSDEEEIEASRKKYNFNDQYNNAKQILPEYIKNVDPNLLSYTALALGIEWFYSQEVDEVYYKKKKEFLSGSKIKVDPKDNIQNKLLKEVIKECFSLVNRDDDFRNELYSKYINPNKDFIEEVANSLAEKIRYIIKQRNKTDLLPQLSDEVSKLKENIQSFILELKDIELPETKTFNIQQMASNLNIQDKMLGEGASNVIVWLKGKELVDNDGKLISNAVTKKEKQLDQRIEQLEKNASDFEKIVLRQIKNKKKSSALNHLQKAPLTQNKLKSLFSENKDDTAIQKLDENKYQITTRDLAGSKWEDLYRAAPVFFQMYLPYELQDVQNELLQNVENKLENIFIQKAKSIINEVKIKRVILDGDDSQFRFESENLIDFIANLRLSNRAQKRYIKNALNTTSELPKEYTFQRSWKFGQNLGLALESQKVTYNQGEEACARSDMVNNLENYFQINGLINKIKKESGADDKLVATAIQQILECKNIQDIHDNHDEAVFKKNTRKHIINITYLMFGCEVVRNPSSLITGLMLLDLISHGELTWEEALDSDKNHKYGGGMMPMSIGEGKGKEKGEAVPCARALQKQYKPYILCSYFYPGGVKSNKNDDGKEKIQELVSREAKVVEKWIERVKKEEDQQKTTTSKSDTSNSTSDVSWRSKILSHAKERINQLPR